MTEPIPSILESCGRVHINKDNFHITSADRKTGTDFEGIIVINGENYIVKMHNKRKLTEKQCFDIFRKNVDILAILSERYLLNGTKSITYDHKNNSLKREFADHGTGKKKTEKSENIDIHSLGTVLNDHLRVNTSKKNAYLPKQKNQEVEKVKEQEIDENEAAVPADKFYRRKLKEKAVHIQNAVDLYNIWKSGGGSLPRIPYQGEIVIERKGTEPVRREYEFKKKWWREEWEKLQESLKVLKEKMDPAEYQKLEKEAMEARREAYESSDLSGWGLGREFVDQLQKNPAKLEGWHQFLIKKKARDMDYYKEHVECILNSKNWTEKKQEILQEYQNFFTPLKEEIKEKVNRVQFYENQEKFFAEEMKKRFPGVEDSKILNKNAKTYFRDVIQYRGKALLRREKMKTPGWSLTANQVIMRKAEYQQKWANFLKELRCDSDEQLFELIVYYGISRGPKNPPVELLVNNLQDYFQSYFHDSHYKMIVYEDDKLPNVEIIKDSDSIKGLLAQVADNMLRS